MTDRKRTAAWHKEWARQLRQEDAYLRKNTEVKQSQLNCPLAEKAPLMLRETLEGAFVKSFGVIFQRCGPALERTISRQRLEQQYQIDRFAAGVRGDRKSLRTFSRRAGQAGAASLAFSGAEGVVLGALGVGIPDIPLFTGVLLRSLYEIAGCHGCGWDTPEERYFQLRLIEGALSGGEELYACNAALNEFIREPKLPDEYDEKIQLERTARALSDQMLAMKFLQGIPGVGVVGGACDAVCLSRVQRYAKLKYQRRVLLSQRENTARIPPRDQTAPW